MKQVIKLNVNGVSREAIVEPHQTLLEVLRDQFDLTGVREGCDRLGECGTCTVLMDGRPVLSCLVLAIEAQDREILTVEGLSTGEKLHPIQESFIRNGAIQCGFCTPGMILTAKSLLDENPNPQESDIRDAISGNLCRCTGYIKIIKAIKDVSGKKTEGT